MKSLKILFATAIALSITNAWANLIKSGTEKKVCDEDTELCHYESEVCSPKVHFKLPDRWTNAYLITGGNSLPFPKADADGWSTIDLGTAKANDDTYFFISSISSSACYDGTCVTRKGVNANQNNARIDGFTCKDIQTDGGDIWIMEHPDPKKAGQVYIKQEKPVVKDFYVLLPQNRTWMSSTPLINENGIDRELYVDMEHCGWYYRRYIDEKLPNSVVIHMAEDEKPYKHAISMDGINTIFSIFETDTDYKDALYFIADENIAQEIPEGTNGWFTAYPEADGYCSLMLTATIYDTDAQLHPSFSCWSYGGEGCQLAKGGVVAQGADSATAITAIDACIGVTSGIVESTLDSKTKKPTLSAIGKKCFIDNKYFNQLFNYTEGVNEKTYFDMPFYRTIDGKWEFDSDYYISPGLDIPVQGGFYPAEGKTDAMVLAVDPKQKPVPAARTKRLAEGPVFWGPELRKLDPSEQVPVIDIFCNGPGWSKGYNCDGLFADGDGTSIRINEDLKLGTGLSEACVFGWSCDIMGYAPEGWPLFVQGSENASTGTSSYSHRWTSEEGSKGNGGRNQHFCFESHAKFAFKKGLKFSIRGDDDIWVFINNKLAVDLGGTHLSAPGYVDLDFFMKDAKVDSIYDIDVFFCDRRTTMSNMRINTNIFMYQHEESTISPKSSSSSVKTTSSTSAKSSDSQSAKSSSSVSGSKSKSSSSTSKDSKSSSSKNSKSSSSNKDAKSKSSSSSAKHYAKPSFHVEMVAPFEFDIVFDDDTPSLAKQYAVMDMKGQVLFLGELSSASTRVKVPTSGSYIVNVGYNYKRVNVK